MQLKIANLADVHLHIRARGASEFLSPDFSGGTKKDGIIDWDPGVEGVLCGEAAMSAQSDHDGERHLGGDETLYLISGRMRLWLEQEDGSRREFALNAGEAVLVPQGIWHGLIADEPSRFLFIGGGRTQIRIDEPANSHSG